MMARYTVDLAELQVLYFLAEGFTPREASEEASGEMRERYLIKGSTYTGDHDKPLSYEERRVLRWCLRRKVLTPDEEGHLYFAPDPEKEN